LVRHFLTIEHGIQRRLLFIVEHAGRKDAAIEVARGKELKNVSSRERGPARGIDVTVTG
jgi:hypothetical protein